jgi:hypothetical protein
MLVPFDCVPCTFSNRQHALRTSHDLCALAKCRPYTHARLQVARAVLGLSLPTDLDNLTKPQSEQAQRALPRAAIVEHATQLAGDDDYNPADGHAAAKAQTDGALSAAQISTCLEALLEMAVLQRDGSGLYAFDQDTAVHAVRSKLHAPCT